MEAAGAEKRPGEGLITILGALSRDFNPGPLQIIDYIFRPAWRAALDEAENYSVMVGWAA